MYSKEEIDEVIIELKNNPLFAMSLGSKELFHSNFWAWIMKHDETNTFLSLFFSELKNVDHESLKIQREKQNMDLSIGDSKQGKRYIIENKIKSMPDKGQIIDYQAKIKDDEFGGGILTGLIKPSFDMPNNKWFFISYSSISKCLREMIEIGEFSKHKEIILRYCEMIDNITKLVKNFMDKSAGKLKYDDCSMLDELRFANLCKKIKADDFVKYLKKEIKSEIDKQLIGTGFESKFSYGFSHKNAYVDLRIGKGLDTANEKFLGIQIQGCEYRIDGSRKGNDIKCDDVFEELKSLKWLEDYDASSKTLFNKKTSMTKNYCRYTGKQQNNPYRYVYQYYNIQEQDFSYEKLAKSIMEDANRAIKIIKQSKF